MLVNFYLAIHINILKNNISKKVLFALSGTIEPKRFSDSSESRESWYEKLEKGDYNQSCIVKRWKRYCNNNLKCKSNICMCPSNSTLNGKYCGMN